MLLLLLLRLLIGGGESRSLLQKQQHPQVTIEKRPAKTQMRAGTKNMNVMVCSYDNILR